MVIKINYTSSDVYVSTSVSPVYVVVNYSGTSGGGGAVWGGITGTLSDQTDLQTALDDKVPYTGATADVDLGEFELSAGQVTLDTTPTGTASVGTTRWNDTIGSSETTLKGGNVILKNGVDLVARVVNKVTPNATLTKAAYQAVRISGAQGQRLAVALAQANNDANSADTIGLVTETIAANQEGFIMTMGNLEGINTTGSLQGETWADGDVLYLSPTTAGRLTNIKPTGATGHIVVVGYVEYAHVNNGKIYVKVMNGWELDELHNVYITSPTNNQVLTYESATSLWKNKTVSAGITGSGVSGQLTYWNGTGSVTGSSNLIWDNTNSRLGIGTSTPLSALELVDTSASEYVAVARLLAPNTNVSGRNAQFYLGTQMASGNSVAWTFYYAGNNSASNYQAWSFNGVVTPNMVMFRSGNNTIGGTTDAGYKLDVNGTARVSNAALINGDVITPNAQGQKLALTVTTNGTTRLSIDSTASGVDFNTGFKLGNGSVSKWSLATYGTNADFVFYNDVTATNSLFIAGSTNNVVIGGSTDAGYKLDVNGTARVTGEFTSGTATIGGRLTTTGYAEVSSSGNASYVFSKSISNIATMWQIYTDASNDLAIFRNGVNRELFKIFDSSKNVGIDDSGGITDIASAKLFINSTTKGFLMPRMTTTQRDAIATPATGLQIYNTTTNENNTYNGTAWVAAGSTSPAGSNTQIQYNNSGAFGASANLVWDNANSILNLSASTSGSQPTLDIRQTLNTAATWMSIRNTNVYGTGTVAADLGIVGGSNQFFNGTVQGDIAFKAYSQANTSKFFLGATSGSTANLTLFTTGNIGVNTNTDAGYKLDVNGTARVSGDMLVEKNQNAATNITISNTTSGASSSSSLTAATGSTNGITIGKYSSTTSTFKIINANDGYIYNGQLGDIAILNDNATGKIKFAAGATSTAQMTLTAAGRLLLGTTSESTYLLDVNSSVRFGSNFIWNNSDGRLDINGAAKINGVIITGNPTVPSGTGASLTEGYYSVGGYAFFQGYNYTTSAYIPIYIDGLVTYINPNSGGNVGINTSTNVPSAQLHISSTTRGFLPPRMTTTEKNAIGTPAAGLQVYDTTLNQMSYYNGTTWINF